MSTTIEGTDHFGGIRAELALLRGDHPEITHSTTTVAEAEVIVQAATALRQRWDTAWVNAQNESQFAAARASREDEDTIRSRTWDLWEEVQKIKEGIDQLKSDAEIILWLSQEEMEGFEAGMDADSTIVMPQ